MLCYCCSTIIFSAYATHNAWVIQATMPDALVSPKKHPLYQWVSLTILRTEKEQPENNVGMVEFRALYDDTQGIHTMHERRTFKRINQQWVYTGAQPHATQCCNGSRP